LEQALAAPRLTRSQPGRHRARPLVEFLLVGGVTPLVLLLSVLYRDAVGPSDAEYRLSFLMFYAAWVINDPHFAVSYLLFYRNLKQRALGQVFRGAQQLLYLVAGFVVPLLLLSWTVIALARESAPMVGLMIQLMFFLVGWHYVKQGFGVLTVLSARQNVRFTPLERRVVLGHCFAGWLCGWATPADPGTEYSNNGVFYHSLAHPPGLDVIAAAVFWVSAAGLLVVLLLKWRREGRLPPLAALCGYLMSIWLWTVFSNLDPLFVYVIPALHSVQYLYFVWLLKRNEAHAVLGEQPLRGSVARRLGLLALSSIALGWLLFRGVPVWLDDLLVLHDASDPAGVMGLGATPYVAALSAFVNIHHYFMDHVIWRRENPETRYLSHDVRPELNAAPAR
jgi:hypothetical protein